MFVSGYLLQLDASNSEKISRLIDNITLGKVIQGVLLVVLAYWGQIFVAKIINWLAEKVPLKYRLKVKQSLPFWRAFVLGVVGVSLMNLFLNLSADNILPLTGTIAVALGFAFKDYASSVIAGVLALFENPYQVGDRIKIGDDYGEVISYGLRGIMLQTPDDNIVTIPHNKLWTESISNANKGNLEAQTVISFYFSHDVDIENVFYLLYRVAQTSKYTQLNLPILVVMEEKPWATYFKLKCYPIDARDEFIYQTDLVRRAKRYFQRDNLPYPILPPLDNN
ncbi:mechanosensitive ion channel family protein [Cyanobacterium aponinum UTEX 3222]|uniref:mechanosensitive ion channel family protein n=1 Tax=Cyanobacterium aponinum TaxID=379064 RepID=UPI002B4C2365|nr:mechanosensitive ion channel family protein [Cyanobacterium aponinum]WRL40190.1 mechanosensitive ion channel family protein [Cyanobacterium aponinum UTEX 3221]WRL43091.1 mechanosensitive ion channel family protein [Cyanobacterium aponinum UTEX 3222]